jgi:hypothetical protein
MPTAATATEDSRSKLIKNHPHDFTMRQNIERYRRMLENPRDDAQRRIILKLLGEEEALRDQAAQADEVP